MLGVLAGIGLVAVLVIVVRVLASRSEQEGDRYLEETYGSNRRPYGILFLPRYLQRFTRDEPDDRP